MKELENIKLLKDFHVHFYLIQINIKYHQSHNIYIYFENYLKQVLLLMKAVFHILFEMFLIEFHSILDIESVFLHFSLLTFFFLLLRILNYIYIDFYIEFDSFFILFSVLLFYQL